MNDRAFVRCGAMVGADVALDNELSFGPAPSSFHRMRLAAAPASLPEV